jgi:dTDP-4-dehydrorhamnose 3,5-epimerase
MDIKPTHIEGCFEISPKVFRDHRGEFIKVFNQDIFREHGLETHFKEEFYSVSQRRVLRGLHFQVPPMDHAKLVFCVLGQIFDVAVDLRVGSPTFGKWHVSELSSERANMLYLDPGLAHGFYAQSEKAVVVYKVTEGYSQAHDWGIRWDSIGIPWPDKHPVLSDRDCSFPGFTEFNSPFIYPIQEPKVA